MGLKSILADIFVPLTCACCGRYARSEVCPACRAEFVAIGEPMCSRCGKPTLHAVTVCRECRGRRLHFERAGALWRYEGRVRELVKALKYSNRRGLVTALTEEMLDLVPSGGRLDAVCWVPMLPGKERRRGYNQARLLGESLAGRLGLEPCDWLTKTKKTLDQNRLERQERLRNNKGAFACREPEAVAGRNVLLVDDVYTTGSTASECARALRDCGAASVTVVTIARAVVDD